jgi:hypothetical protein
MLQGPQLRHFPYACRTDPIVQKAPKLRVLEALLAAGYRPTVWRNVAPPNLMRRSRHCPVLEVFDPFHFHSPNLSPRWASRSLTGLNSRVRAVGALPACLFPPGVSCGPCSPLERPSTLPLAARAAGWCSLQRAAPGAPPPLACCLQGRRLHPAAAGQRCWWRWWR